MRPSLFYLSYFNKGEDCSLIYCISDCNSPRSIYSTESASSLPLAFATNWHLVTLARPSRNYSHRFALLKRAIGKGANMALPRQRKPPLLLGWNKQT